MNFNVESVYDLDEVVYYNTPDSDRGFILDIRYNVRHGMVEYLVSFGRRNEDTNWCIASELSDIQIFY